MKKAKIERSLNFHIFHKMNRYETIQVVLSGGMFIIALVTLIVKMLNNDKKTNR